MLRRIIMRAGDIPNVWWVILGLLPKLAYAAGEKNLEWIVGKLCEALDWIFTFAIITGVIFILLAAIKYMSARGDTEKFSEAHRALFYGIVGLTVAILAKGVPFIILNFFESEDLAFKGGQAITQVCQ